MKNHREYKTLFPVTQFAIAFSVDGDASITKLNTDAKKLTLAEHLAQLVADCILGKIVARLVRYLPLRPQDQAVAVRGLRAPDVEGEHAHVLGGHGLACGAVDHGPEARLGGVAVGVPAAGLQADPDWTL